MQRWGSSSQPTFHSYPLQVKVPSQWHYASITTNTNFHLGLQNIGLDIGKIINQPNIT